MKTIHSTRFLGPCIAFLLTASPTLRAQTFVYPAQGQSPEQQRQDEFECHTWAVEQSGFDPISPSQPTTAPPPREAPQGGLLQGGARGAAGGAAVGAVGGAIGGRPGRGAAIGAAVGGLIGSMQRQDQRSQQQQAQANSQAEQQTIQAQGRDAYERARTTCLTGRGYTVQ
jgi:hypothetical protein